MPGLHLTLAQARRLWHADEATCRAALEELVRTHFLVLRASGRFSRAPESLRHAPAKPRMAKASVPDDHDARRRAR